MNPIKRADLIFAIASILAAASMIWPVQAYPQVCAGMIALFLFVMIAAHLYETLRESFPVSRKEKRKRGE